MPSSFQRGQRGGGGGKGWDARHKYMRGAPSGKQKRVTTQPTERISWSADTPHHDATCRCPVRCRLYPHPAAYRPSSRLMQTLYASIFYMPAIFKRFKRDCSRQTGSRLCTGRGGDRGLGERRSKTGQRERPRRPSERAMQLGGWRAQGRRK